MKPPLILLFLKAPEAGRVKTRLAAEVGNETALAVYRQLVEDQLKRSPPAWRIRVMVDPPGSEQIFHAWLGRRPEYRPQVVGDLGARLSSAVSEAFDEGADTVFCVGGDCPTLDARRLVEAAASLQEGNDLVFIPAEDGGYVLLGLNGPYPEVFETIPWSTADTLSVSLSRVGDAGRKVALLSTTFDIDTRADLERAVGEKYFAFLPDTTSVTPVKPF